MRKIIIAYMAITLAGCGVKGVEENITEDLPPADTTVKDNVPNVDGTLVDTTGAVIPVNFDTAFNFTKNKGLDSIKLKSGVTLVHLGRGNGPAIKQYDAVAINYRGMLTNGKMIESNASFKTAVPFVVGLGLTFDAFDEVLLQCHVGDRVKFTIPAAKAYGTKGRDKVIPPNSDLVYEMDILQKVEGKKTKSGVQYFMLISNSAAPMPAAGNTVAIAYRGWIKKTGKMFDASAVNGQLYEFVLGTGAAIDAWQETVALMHRGEKMLVLAPAAACYGSRGVPELVPPNSDLVYILELKDFRE